MVDFSLDEQQLAHASWVRGLMDKHVRPAVSELDRLRDEKREAARDYEEALIARGWQIPGLAIGPLARAARW